MPACLSASIGGGVLICNILLGSPGHFPQLPERERAQRYRGLAVGLGDGISSADWIPLGKAHIQVYWTYWLTLQGTEQSDRPAVMTHQLSSREAYQRIHMHRKADAALQALAFKSCFIKK